MFSRAVIAFNEPLSLPMTSISIICQNDSCLCALRRHHHPVTQRGDRSSRGDFNATMGVNLLTFVTNRKTVRVICSHRMTVIDGHPDQSVITHLSRNATSHFTPALNPPANQLKKTLAVHTAYIIDSREVMF